MANPIHFKPKVDPQTELRRRLEAAPEQHAEALLVLFDVIEEAHNQGLLDLLHGAVGSKNAIAGKLAYYAKQPMTTQALRNLLILGELLGSFDPTILADTKNEVLDRHKEPPSLWCLFRQAISADGRRGMGMFLAFVCGAGKSAQTSDT
ncbi:DUF1641 domain-containing protein [Granulicella sp. L46]|uniref:DUF1641 domain-containing protein n=1 Tax=Granulicella sp. L46 TaxID=1641865 RepID=UPI00131C3A94|nr:DUF1641 domain-containing protein [Granulicella sp. L46]